VKLDYRAQTLQHDGEPSPAVQFARKCNKLLEKTTIRGFDPYGYAQKSLKQRRKYLKARVKIFELQRNLSLQLILCCSFREANQGEADQRGQEEQVIVTALTKTSQSRTCKRFVNKLGEKKNFFIYFLEEKQGAKKGGEKV